LNKIIDDLGSDKKIESQDSIGQFEFLFVDKKEIYHKKREKLKGKDLDLKVVGNAFHDYDTNGNNNHDYEMDIDEVEGLVTSTKRVDFVVESVIPGKD